MKGRQRLAPTALVVLGLLTVLGALVQAAPFLAERSKNLPKVLSSDDVEQFASASGSNNICNYYATDNELKTLGLAHRISDFCHNEFGTRPDEVHLNPDDYPYKSCLEAGRAQWFGLEPSSFQRVIARDLYNNTTPQTLSHTFELEGSYQQSMSLATTNTVSLSTSVSYSVDIPEIFKAKFSISTSFETSSTKTYTAQSDAKYRSSTTMDCTSHCAYTVDMQAEINVYRSDVRVPICLTGYARCQYSHRVRDHYFWYVWVDSFIPESDRCFLQDGVLSSSISIDTKTVPSVQCY